MEFLQFQKAVSPNPSSSTLEINYCHAPLRRSKSCFCSNPSTVQKVRRDHSISCYFRAHMCLPWRHFTGIWFPVFFPGFGLQKSKKHIFKNKFIKMKYSELVVTGLSGTECTPPGLHSVAQPWLCIWRMWVTVKAEVWPVPAFLLPSQTPAKLRCVGSWYLLRPKLSTQESRGPPSMKTFPMSASTTADCCQWENSVIVPLL